MVYARLFESAMNVSDTCYVDDLEINENELYTAYWAFDYDNPQFLELGSGYSYSHYPSTGMIVYINIDFGRQSSEVPQERFNDTMNTVLANAKSLSGGYEKLKYCHDWLVNNSVYYQPGSDTKYIREADGPVVYGTAVCEGYAKAFMYLAQSLGYECVCVVGKGNGTSHMWNMVKLDGHWYHVDVTWDDPIMSDGSNRLYHDYFLVSDSKIQANHTIENPFTVPSAPSNYVQ